MAVGFGYYGIAIFTAVIVMVTLVAIKPIEDRFFKNRHNRRRGDPAVDEPG